MNQNARMQLDHDIPRSGGEGPRGRSRNASRSTERSSPPDMADRASKRLTDEVDAIPRLHRTGEEVGVWLVTRASGLATDASRWPGAKGVRR